jgi:hypothetical protein
MPVDVTKLRKLSMNDVRIIREFEATGRSVDVQPIRGRISISGGQFMPLKDGLERIKRTLRIVKGPQPKAFASKSRRRRVL